MRLNHFIATIAASLGVSGAALADEPLMNGIYPFYCEPDTVVTITNEGDDWKLINNPDAQITELEDGWMLTQADEYGVAFLQETDDRKWVVRTLTPEGYSTADCLNLKATTSEVFRTIKPKIAQNVIELEGLLAETRSALVKETVLTHHLKGEIKDLESRYAETIDLLETQLNIPHGTLENSTDIELALNEASNDASLTRQLLLFQIIGGKSEYHLLNFLNGFNELDEATRVLYSDYLERVKPSLSGTKCLTELAEGRLNFVEKGTCETQLIKALLLPLNYKTPNASLIGSRLPDLVSDALRLSIYNCWNTGSLSRSALNTSVELSFELSDDWRPISNTITLTKTDGTNGDAVTQAFEAARRAILRCGINGFEFLEGEVKEDTIISVTFEQ